MTLFPQNIGLSGGLSKRCVLRRYRVPVAAVLYSSTLISYQYYVLAVLPGLLESLADRTVVEIMNDRHWELYLPLLNWEAAESVFERVFRYFDFYLAILLRVDRKPCKTRFPRIIRAPSWMRRRLSSELHRAWGDDAWGGEEESSIFVNVVLFMNWDSARFIFIFL